MCKVARGTYFYLVLAVFSDKLHLQEMTFQNFRLLMENKLGADFKWDERLFQFLDIKLISFPGFSLCILPDLARLHLDKNAQDRSINFLNLDSEHTVFARVCL